MQRVGGKFVLREAEAALFVAGGVGISPLYGMLRAWCLRAGTHSRAALLFAARSRAERLFATQLEGLARAQDLHDRARAAVADDEVRVRDVLRQRGAVAEVLEGDGATARLADVLGARHVLAFDEYGESLWPRTDWLALHVLPDSLGTQVVAEPLTALDPEPWSTVAESAPLAADGLTALTLCCLEEQLQWPVAAAAARVRATAGAAGAILPEGIVRSGGGGAGGWVG